MAALLLYAAGLLPMHDKAEAAGREPRSYGEWRWCHVCNVWVRGDLQAHRTTGRHGESRQLNAVDLAFTNPSWYWDILRACHVETSMPECTEAGSAVDRLGHILQHVCAANHFDFVMCAGLYSGLANARRGVATGWVMTPLQR